MDAGAKAGLIRSTASGHRSRARRLEVLSIPLRKDAVPMLSPALHMAAAITHVIVSLAYGGRDNPCYRQPCVWRLRNP
jgi:hypothetical protein